MNLVIFDCDGTLIDSQHNITAAMALAFRTHGLDAPPGHSVLGVVGLSLKEAFAVLAPDESEATRKTLAEAYRTAHAEGRLERQHEALYPGIKTVVETLAARPDMLLGIATGKSKRGVRRLLDQHDWHDAFVTIQTADDHPSKPHPSMVLTALAEAGVEPHRAVMVGDTSFDMAMAASAGVGALGVAWGYHRPELLTAAGAHDVIRHGDDLLAAIEARLSHQAAASEASP